MKPDMNKTRSEQYIDAITRVQDGLDEGNLEYAMSCIQAAQWIKYDIGDAQVVIIGLVVDQQYDVAIDALVELQEDIERIDHWG